MARIHELKNKISIIDNTKKITSTMEMVAASKLKKTQNLMLKSRPYAEKIVSIINHISMSNVEYNHPFLSQQNIERVAYIIVSSDTGLCGGLNNNLFRAVIYDMQKHSKKNIAIDLYLIGAKAESFFKRCGGNVIASISHLGDQPSLSQLIGLITPALNDQKSGKIQKLYLCFNKFINTMVQKIQILPLLPIIASTESQAEVKSHNWDYIYEPNAEFLLNLILLRYIESLVYQAVMENIACKQAAQMIAMKSATDNASDIIYDLKLLYNKARQATITQEIIEIVTGAESI